MAELKKSFDLDLDRLIDTIAKTHNLDANKLRADVSNEYLPSRIRRQKELQRKINEATRAYYKKIGKELYSNIPDRLVGVNFSQLKEDENNLDSLHTIVDLLNSNSKKGILLYGTVGTFKVKTLAAIGQALVDWKKERVYYNTEEKFLSEIRNAYHGKADKNEDDLIREICKHDSILIEEFGQANSEWSVKTIRKLVDEIWSKNKKIYLTLSYDPIKLMYKWGASETNTTPHHILSRLNEMCKFIKIEEEITGGYTIWTQ